MGAALGDLKSITSGSSDLQGQLAGRGAGMLKMTRGIRQTSMAQLLEAMKTGGVKAQIPLIQQAVSQSNRATSNALATTAEQLASRNVGAPFAQRVMAEGRMQGAQTAAAIPTQMAQSLISQYLPFAGQLQSLGMGAFSTAAQSAQQLAEFNAAQRQQSILQGGILGGGRIAGIL